MTLSVMICVCVQLFLLFLLHLKNLVYVSVFCILLAGKVLFLLANCAKYFVIWITMRQHARNNSNGNYPLHIAAQNEFADLCELLLAAKHDPNKQNFSGHTALHMAIGYGCNDVAELLVLNGADPNIRSDQGE